MERILPQPVNSPGGIDGYDRLIDKLPPVLRTYLDTYADTIEELILDINRPLRLVGPGDKGYLRIPELVITRHHLEYIVHRLGGFRDSKRAGIERTLHRFSAIEDAEHDLAGMTIRVARYFPGIADPIRALIEQRRSLMIVGRPGVGKTSFLRDYIHQAADIYGPKLIVVDSANEIAGDGLEPHPFLGDARRMQVPSIDQQASILMQALVNHGPSLIVIDELGYRPDVETILTIGRRGIKVTATVHGGDLRDVVSNPDLHPVLGIAGNRRIASPTFDLALEIRERGKYHVSRLDKSVDRLLAGEPYDTVLYPDQSGSSH